MAQWVNRYTGLLARNATTTQVASFGFLPQPGNLLVLLVYAPSTIATPAGWTLRASGTGGNGTLYTFTKLAGAAESSVTLTTGATNLPVGATVYEFSPDFTYVNAQGGSALALNAASTAVSGLTGTLQVLLAVATSIPTGASSTGATWSGGSPAATEDYDINTNFSGTDGLIFSTAVSDGTISTSFTATGSITGTSLPASKATVSIALRGPINSNFTGANSSALALTSNTKGMSPTVGTLGTVTATHSNLESRTGSTSMRMVTNNASSQSGRFFPVLPQATTNRMAARSYFKLPVETLLSPALGATSTIMGFLTGSNVVVAAAYMNASEQIVFRGASGDLWTSTSKLPRGAWVRLEIGAKVGTSTTNGAADFAFYLGDSLTPVEGTIGSLTAVDLGINPIARLAFGRYTTAAGQGIYYWDDVEAGERASGFFGPAGEAQMVDVGFVGVASSVRTVAGQLPISVGVTGAGFVYGVSTSGQLSANAGLAGSATAVVILSTTGSLPAQVGATATAEQVWITTGALGVGVGNAETPFRGFASTVLTTSGGSPATAGLTGSTSTSAQLPASAGLTGSAVSVRVTSGTLPVSVGQTGVSSTASTTSGSLPTVVGLASATSTTGQLATSAGLSGAASVVLVASGTLPVSIGQVGGAAATSSTSGSLPLTTALTAFVSTMGQAPVSTGLAGSAISVRITSGALPISIGQTGAPTTANSTSGSLPVSVGTGTTGVGAQFTASGSLPVSITQGAIQSTVGTSTAQLPGSIGLVAQPGTTATVPTGVGFSGSSIQVRTTTGVLSVDAGATGSVSSSSSTSGSLPIGVATTGAAATALATSGQLPITVNLASSSSTSGSLPVAVGAGGTASRVTSTTGVLPIGVQLTGTPGQGVAPLPANIGLVGSPITVYTQTRSLSASVGLTASAQTVLSTTGTLPVGVSQAGRPGTTGQLPARVEYEGIGLTAGANLGQWEFNVGMAATVRVVFATTGSLPAVVGMGSLVTQVRVTSGQLPVGVRLAPSTPQVTGAVPVSVGLTGSPSSVTRASGSEPIAVGFTGVASSVEVRSTSALLPLAVGAQGAASTVLGTSATLGATAALRGLPATTSAEAVQVGLQGSAVTVLSTQAILNVGLGLAAEALIVLLALAELRVVVEATGTPTIVGAQGADFVLTGPIHGSPYRFAGACAVRVQNAFQEPVGSGYRFGRARKE